MKPTSLLRTGAAMILFAVALSSQAQFAKNNRPTPATLKAATAAGKDEIVLDGLKLSNEKMHRNLTKMFGSPANISIREGDSNTIITFEQDEMRHHVLFTKKGTWLQTIRYYETSKLDKNIRHLVEAAFPEYDLLRVTEVNVGGNMAHLIDIESQKHFKVIRVINGEWDIYNQFDKHR